MERAALECVMWGGDVHVPHGDTARARDTGRRTRDAGFTLAGYGSYYRLDVSEREGLAFQTVLDTAVALGAPVIRVWAGRRACEAGRPDHYRRAVDDALRIAALARQAGLAIAFEHHSGTFTDTVESTSRFLADTAHPAVFSLWQPPNGRPGAYCLQSLAAVLPRLHHAHVFHWWPDAGTRLPLADGEARWPAFLRVLKEHGRDIDLLLEFTRGDSPVQLLADAATLKRWISGLR